MCHAELVSASPENKKDPETIRRGEQGDKVEFIKDCFDRFICLATDKSGLAMTKKKI